MTNFDSISVVEEKNSLTAEQLYEEERYDEAYVEYTKLADKGEVDCQVFVGWMCLNGVGTMKSDAQAFGWYEKASEAGSKEAQFELAKLYAKRKDFKKSLESYQMAADQNYSPALYRLGWVYDMGRGVSKDKDKAFLFYKKSADLGNIFGIKNTALLLIKGHKGVLNRFLGVFLFVKAIIITISVGLKDSDSEQLID